MNSAAALRQGLAAALVAAGELVGSDDDAVALASRFVALSARGLHTSKPLATALKLRSEELGQLRDELQRWLAELKGEAASARNLEMAELRCVLWFETAQSLNAPAALVPPPSAGDDPLPVLSLLRTLELMMRALIEEQHPQREVLEQRMRELMPTEARDALKRSGEQPLSGLFLKELIRFFIDPTEWTRLGAPFERSAFLNLLRDKRATAASFLEDVRRIRNAVAHWKSLSVAQVRLLHLYYEELVEPVRAAHRAGTTQVDPARFEGADASELKIYLEGVRVELGRDVRRTQRLALAGLALSLLLAAAALPVLLPMLQLRLDPDRAYIDAYHQRPADLGSLALQACELARPEALARLAQQPQASTALAGNEAEALHARVMRLAADTPARLTPCVPTLRAMGWDPLRIDGNAIGSYFPGGGPPGYASFVAAHPQGLLGQSLLSPSMLRVPVLQLAVWQNDATLVRALVQAGAESAAPGVVDGRIVGRVGDVPVPGSDSASEARRIGQLDLIAALQRP